MQKLRLGCFVSDIVSGNASLNEYDKNKIPRTYRLGLALQPTQKITIAVEGMQRNSSRSFRQRNIRLGTELQPFLSFVMLRAGIRSANAQGTTAYFGGGLKFSFSDFFKMQCDYAFSTATDSDLGDTHRISLSFAFIEPPEYYKEIESWKRELCRDSDKKGIREKVAVAYRKWLSRGISDPMKDAQVRDQLYAWQKLEDGFRSYLAGKYRDAIPLLNEAIKRDANLAEAHKILALTYWKLGQINRAESEKYAALKIEPETQMPDQLMADIKTYKKGQSNYKESFRKGVIASGKKDYQMMIQHFKTALLWTVSYDRILRGQISRAYEEWLKLEKAFETPEQKKEIENQQAAWNLLIQGYRLYIEKDYERVIQILEESLKFDPKLTEAYKWLGCAYALKGNKKKAENAFQQALKLQPDLMLIGNVPEKARQIFYSLKGKE